MADEPSPEPEIEDLRPPGHWGRHPLTKVVGFSAIAAMGLGGDVAAGATGVLIMAGGGIVFTGLCFAAAIAHMRGLVSPLPGRDGKLLSPISGMIGAAAVMLACVLLALHVVSGSDGPSSWFTAGMVVVVATVLVAVFVQIASLSDQWPDTWRPPYARQAPATDTDDQAGSNHPGDEP